MAEEKYDADFFYGNLLKGDLRTAMAYLGRFPEQSGRYHKYISLFQEECYLAYDADAELNEILLVYQKYYRDVFYLEKDTKEAALEMRTRLAGLFQLDAGVSLDDMEKEQVAEAFRSRGFHFLGGRTGGYYGPYIWKTETLEHYMVELPDGMQEYTVKFLEDFLLVSWLDYLSFGEIGTGGWSDDNGLIHCIKASYDLKSEHFRVSLLKHEAQHAADLSRFRTMTSEDLEYRAKLVELIYSDEQKLLPSFVAQADGTKAGNAHALAAWRIIKGLEQHLKKHRNEFEALSVSEVQMAAKKLFAESTREAVKRYLEKTEHLHADVSQSD